MRIHKILAAFSALMVLAATTFAATNPADTVFTNGRIYTDSDKQPWAEAIAITGKNIVSVGSNKDAKVFIGDKTEIVDLEGRLVLPGMIDTHMHVRIAGQNSVMLNLFPTLGGPREVADVVDRPNGATRDRVNGAT